MSLDVDSIQGQARAHHAKGDTVIDDEHNIQHARINEGLKRFKIGGGGLKIARGIVEDATQLKITADLLGEDGDKHLNRVKKSVNTGLPNDDKFYIAKQ